MKPLFTLLFTLVSCMPTSTLTAQIPVNDPRLETLSAKPDGSVLIRAAYYHELGHYSVMVSDQGRIRMKHFWLSSTQAQDAEFKFDVKMGDMRWLQTDYREGNGWTTTTRCSYFILHLHSPEELNGAGWSIRNNKTTVTGTTVPIR